MTTGQTERLIEALRRIADALEQRNTDAGQKRSTKKLNRRIALETSPVA